MVGTTVVHQRGCGMQCPWETAPERCSEPGKWFGKTCSGKVKKCSNLVKCVKTLKEPAKIGSEPGKACGSPETGSKHRAAPAGHSVTPENTWQPQQNMACSQENVLSLVKLAVARVKP